MASANYTVSITITSDTNFTASSGWGYLAGITKTTTGFTILLNSSAGAAFNAPASTTVDWIAIPNN
jgi:hypothetical protein